MSILLPVVKVRIPLQVGLLVVGFVVLATMSLTSLWLARESDQASEEVTHTLEVNASIVAYQSALRRAESGQRGFLLTGEKSYLDDYAIGVRHLEEMQPDLLQRITDNPAQQARLETIQPLLQQKLKEMSETVALKLAGQDAAAIALFQTDQGLDLMNQILTQIIAMLGNEQALLAARRDYSGRTNLLLFGVNFAGGLIITVLALASISLLHKRTNQLSATHAELERINEALEERVAERTADLREANDEIQRFAFIVSHDLRSPLVNIMGFTSELEALQSEIFPETLPTPEQRAQQQHDVAEALGFIKSSIGKMDRLINAILNLSRAGRREFNPKPVLLGDLLDSLAGDLAHRLQDIDGRIEIAEAPQIVSDRLALEQIFSNLLENAIKYRRLDTPLHIRISSEERDNFIVLQVSDNGRGIDKKDYERIFELFRRSGIQDRPGEGIGLAHVRAVVRRLGGSIRVDSELGRSTTFTILLPKHWPA